MANPSKRKSDAARRANQVVRSRTVLMMVLSLLFCAIQAVVFTMLTSIYLDEVTETE